MSTLADTVSSRPISEQASSCKLGTEEAALMAFSDFSPILSLLFRKEVKMEDLLDELDLEGSRRSLAPTDEELSPLLIEDSSKDNRGRVALGEFLVEDMKFCPSRTLGANKRFVTHNFSTFDTGSTVGILLLQEATTSRVPS